MKDTIGPLDQEALEYGSMMPEGWQTEDRDERAELESANDALCEPAAESERRQHENL